MTEHHTELNLRAIRDRVEAATPGPWLAALQRGKTPVVGRTATPAGRGAAIAVFGGGGRQAGRDAEFAAHAREDVPALLDEVERAARAETALQKHAVDEYRQAWREAIALLDGAAAAYTGLAEPAVRLFVIETAAKMRNHCDAATSEEVGRG